MDPIPPRTYGGGGTRPPVLPRRRWWRPVLALVALLLIAGGVAFWDFYCRDVTIIIPQERIQAFLDGRFPIEKTYLAFFTVRYEHPRVDLHDGADRVHVGIEAEASLSLTSRTLRGKGMVSGALNYDRDRGEFYLLGSRIDELAIPGFPEKYAQLAKDGASMLLGGYLDRRPVYRLRQADFRQSLARMTLKQVRIVDAQLEVTMGMSR